MTRLKAYLNAVAALAPTPTIPATSSTGHAMPSPLSLSTIRSQIACDRATFLCSIDLIASTSVDCAAISTALTDAKSGFCYGAPDGAQCTAGLARELDACSSAFEDGATAYSFFYWFMTRPTLSVDAVRFEPACKRSTCSLNATLASVEDCALARSYVGSFCGLVPNKSVRVNGLALHGLCVMAFNEKVDECLDAIYHGVGPYALELMFDADPESFNGDQGALAVSAASTTAFPSVHTKNLKAAAMVVTSTTLASPNPKSALLTTPCMHNGDFKCDKTILLQCSYANGAGMLAWSLLADCGTSHICSDVKGGFVGCKVAGAGGEKKAAAPDAKRATTVTESSHEIILTTTVLGTTTRRSWF
ncbi:hypothetical protein BC830DRAFT_1137240 [Chytriomyces sp. MP71]|nr:hypothetical protein BC830DRAFT_1137240 [Chytriomyces sp. MP71]